MESQDWKSTKDEHDIRGSREPCQNRNGYLIPFLFFIGSAINNFAYSLYYYVTFRSIEYFVDLCLVVKPVKLLYEQKEILHTPLTFFIIVTWMRYLTQGFDGTAFIHVLVGQYKLINKSEMVARVLGSLTAGVLYGIVYSDILGHEKYVNFNDKDFISSMFDGCTESQTFTEIILNSILPVGMLRKAYRFIFVGDSTMSISSNAVVIDTDAGLRAIASLCDMFIFEFSFSLAIYLALSIYIVAGQFCNFAVLYGLFKRFSVLTANAYLKHIHGAICLDAGVALRRYFEDRNRMLLVIRLMANLLAVLVVGHLFNPTLSIPYRIFRDLYYNVEPSKLEEMCPGSDPHSNVSSTSISDQDIKYSSFPQSRLGRMLERWSCGTTKVKVQ